ncbi:hypothetical protein DPMN_044457 [Dreissena polymorpha]|uniref:Uncharacterized protein n=1 Tax=Dreissena polymorpha TaxID=45954 RepID=A0A9D4HYR6_DREPO|nr:hypothetical protein DPMN_044457 [Dreissena polymorpha]
MDCQNRHSKNYQGLWESVHMDYLRTTVLGTLNVLRKLVWGWRRRLVTTRATITAAQRARSGKTISL